MVIFHSLSISLPLSFSLRTRLFVLYVEARDGISKMEAEEYNFLHRHQLKEPWRASGWSSRHNVAKSNEERGLALLGRAGSHPSPGESNGARYSSRTSTTHVLKTHTHTHTHTLKDMPTHTHTGCLTHIHTHARTHSISHRNTHKDTQPSYLSLASPLLKVTA